MENDNSTTYPFDFKTVNSDIRTTYMYMVDINSTMQEFLDKTRHRMHLYLNLGVNNLEQIEIIEAGQYYNINGRDPEVAPAIVGSDILVKDYFNKRLSMTSFYIRLHSE